MSRLAQYQPVADKDDGNDEHCDTRPGDPGGAFHWQGAGGEVRGFLVVLTCQERDGLEESAHLTGEDEFVCSLMGKVVLEQGLVDGPHVVDKGDNSEGVDGCCGAEPGAGGEDATKRSIKVVVAVG